VLQRFETAREIVIGDAQTIEQFGLLFGRGAQEVLDNVLVLNVIWVCRRHRSSLLRRGSQKCVAPSAVSHTVLEPLPDPAGADAEGFHRESQPGGQAMAVMDLSPLLAPVVFEDEIPVGRR